MKYPPQEARCVFIDGPIAVYVSQAPSADILEAYARVKALVEVAARQMNGPTRANKIINQGLSSTEWDMRIAQAEDARAKGPAKEFP